MHGRFTKWSGICGKIHAPKLTKNTFTRRQEKSGAEAPLFSCNRPQSIAVPQLLYPETTTLKWLFPQGKATFHDNK
jgi:hypothetical protein